MKKLFLLLFNVLISMAANAQILNNTGNKSYFKLKKIGNHGFNQYTKTRDSIEIYRKLNAGEIKSKIIEDGVLNFKPFGISYLILKEEKDVIILNYNDGLYEIQADSLHGYIKKQSILVSEEMDILVEIKEEEESVKKAQLEAEEAERVNKKEETDRKLKLERYRKTHNSNIALINQKYINKYGAKVYKKLKDGYIWLGMTKDMALISLGKPNNINRTVGSWGVHEQWVYGGSYYYFENGKLTSYQD